MSAEFVIREAGPQDEPGTRALFAALQAHEREMEPNRVPPEDAGAHMDRLLDWAGRTGFVLLAVNAEGAPVGLLIGGLEDEGAYVLPENRPHGEVSDLYVAPQARRKGLGAALLAEAERRFRARGVRRMMIGALAANLPARALYARWARGGPHAVLFARDLTDPEGR